MPSVRNFGIIDIKIKRLKFLIFPMKEIIKKYFKASASLIVFPITAASGFVLLSCFWVIFLWKTGPKPPILRGLNFILNHERTSLHSNPILCTFSGENNLIGIEFVLRIPE